MHAEWAEVGTSVPISLDENGVFSSLLVRALGLDAAEGTHRHQQAADGRPIGNRYRSVI